ncbi:MAG: L-serine ammonia-lyase, iron-sulfur-dependent subunit beta [Longimicrobiales bacterium]|nr:L-serine ammonia-lyase, iron-sulfur-dependent subunit beta [Longimicrobiales bacterium]
MVGLFDILGPVMVGPSSSHTAGACRLGLMARAILGSTPDRAVIRLHGSFAATGEGHGTQRALVGGLLGMAPDDLRLRTAFEAADQAGLDYTFEEVDLGDDAHPNSAVIRVEHGDDAVTVRGASVGGGRVEVTEIDGFPVELGGAYDTLVLVARDRPGTIAAISAVFAEEDVNLATMRVDRTGRHKEALMTLEVDSPISDAALEEIRAFDWVIRARRIEKID